MPGSTQKSAATLSDTDPLVLLAKRLASLRRRIVLVTWAVPGAYALIFALALYGVRPGVGLSLQTKLFPVMVALWSVGSVRKLEPRSPLARAVLGVSWAQAAIVAAAELVPLLFLLSGMELEILRPLAGGIAVGAVVAHCLVAARNHGRLRQLAKGGC